MEPNTISVINQIAESQAVWAILFITLAYYFLRQAERREKALMIELSDVAKSLVEISNSMKEISEGQKILGGRVDRMEKVIYKGEKNNEKN